MVRPNGSVIGRDSAGEGDTATVITCLWARSLEGCSYGLRPRAVTPIYARWIPCTMWQFLRVVQCKQCYWAGASCAAGGFLRLGRIGFLGGAGGGGGGRNSATTGFGVMRKVSAANMPPGSLTTCTGMLTGCTPGIE